jgi:hypothetical protein
MLCKGLINRARRKGFGVSSRCMAGLSDELLNMWQFEVIHFSKFIARLYQVYTSVRVDALFHELTVNKLSKNFPISIDEDYEDY